MEDSGYKYKYDEPRFVSDGVSCGFGVNAFKLSKTTTRATEDNNKR